jgi:hypothetical protein
MTNKAKPKMMCLGTGYDLWAGIVDKTLMANKLDDFLTVADEAKKDLLLYCNIFFPLGTQ